MENVATALDIGFGATTIATNGCHKDDSSSCSNVDTESMINTELPPSAECQPISLDSSCTYSENAGGLSSSFPLKQSESDDVASAQFSSRDMASDDGHFQQEITADSIGVGDRIIEQCVDDWPGSNVIDIAHSTSDNADPAQRNFQELSTTVGDECYSVQHATLSQEKNDDSVVSQESERHSSHRLLPGDNGDSDGCSEPPAAECQSHENLDGTVVNSSQGSAECGITVGAMSYTGSDDMTDCRNAGEDSYDIQMSCGESLVSSKDVNNGHDENEGIDTNGDALPVECAHQGELLCSSAGDTFDECDVTMLSKQEQSHENVPCDTLSCASTVDTSGTTREIVSDSLLDTGNIDTPGSVQDGSHNDTSPDNFECTSAAHDVGLPCEEADQAVDDSNIESYTDRVKEGVATELEMGGELCVDMLRDGPSDVNSEITQAHDIETNQDADCSSQVLDKDQYTTDVETSAISVQPASISKQFDTSSLSDHGEDDTVEESAPPSGTQQLCDDIILDRIGVRASSEESIDTAKHLDTRLNQSPECSVLPEEIGFQEPGSWKEHPSIDDYTSNVDSHECAQNSDGVEKNSLVLTSDLSADVVKVPSALEHNETSYAGENVIEQSEHCFSITPGLQSTLDDPQENVHNEVTRNADSGCGYNNFSELANESNSGMDDNEKSIEVISAVHEVCSLSTTDVDACNQQIPDEPSDTDDNAVELGYCVDSAEIPKAHEGVESTNAALTSDFQNDNLVGVSNDVPSNDPLSSSPSFADVDCHKDMDGSIVDSNDDHVERDMASEKVVAIKDSSVGVDDENSPNLIAGDFVENVCGDGLPTDKTMSTSEHDDESQSATIEHVVELNAPSSDNEMINEQIGTMPVTFAHGSGDCQQSAIHSVSESREIVGEDCREFSSDQRSDIICDNENDYLGRPASDADDIALVMENKPESNSLSHLESPSACSPVGEPALGHSPDSHADAALPAQSGIIYCHGDNTLTQTITGQFDSQDTRRTMDSDCSAEAASNSVENNELLQASFHEDLQAFGGHISCDLQRVPTIEQIGKNDGFISNSDPVHDIQSSDLNDNPSSETNVHASDVLTGSILQPHANVGYSEVVYPENTVESEACEPESEIKIESGIDAEDVTTESAMMGNDGVFQQTSAGSWASPKPNVDDVEEINVPTQSMGATEILADGVVHETRFSGVWGHSPAETTRPLHSNVTHAANDDICTPVADQHVEAEEIGIEATEGTVNKSTCSNIANDHAENNAAASDEVMESDVIGRSHHESAAVSTDDVPEPANDLLSAGTKSKQVPVSKDSMGKKVPAVKHVRKAGATSPLKTARPGDTSSSMKASKTDSRASTTTSKPGRLPHNTAGGAKPSASRVVSQTTSVSGAKGPSSARGNSNVKSSPKSKLISTNGVSSRSPSKTSNTTTTSTMASSSLASKTSRSVVAKSPESKLANSSPRRPAVARSLPSRSTAATANTTTRPSQDTKPVAATKPHSARTTTKSSNDSNKLSTAKTSKPPVRNTSTHRRNTLGAGPASQTTGTASAATHHKTSPNTLTNPVASARAAYKRPVFKSKTSTTTKSSDTAHSSKTNGHAKTTVSSTNGV